MMTYYVTFAVTVYGEFFSKPNSSLHVMSGRFISLHAKPHKTHVHLIWVLWGSRLRSSFYTPLFGFTGCFMMVLSCIYVIIILYRPCIFPSTSPPTSSLLLFLNNNTKNNQKNSRNKPQKSFLDENKRM